MVDTLSTFHHPAVSCVWPQLPTIHVSLLPLTHVVFQPHKKTSSLFKTLKSSIPYSPSTNHFKVKLKVQLRIHLIDKALPWPPNLGGSGTSPIVSCFPLTQSLSPCVWVVSWNLSLSHYIDGLRAGLYLDVLCCPIYLWKRKTAYILVRVVVNEGESKQINKQTITDWENFWAGVKKWMISYRIKKNVDHRQMGGQERAPKGGRI